MPTEEHERIVGRWYGDLFIRGDLDAVDGLVGPDFTAYGAGGDGRVHETRGRENFREWLRWYLSAFAEGDWTVHDVISEGEKAVVRYSGWATYRGGLLGIPSEDQRVFETGILIFRIRDGLVQELWAEMSDLQLVMQLGAFPAAGLGEAGGTGS